MSFAGRERATFLVYSLRSCTHAFPFRSLRYQVKGGRPRASGVAPQGAAPDATFKSKFAPPKDPKHQMLVEQDPSNHLTPRTRSALAAHRFPDLIGKSIWKSVVLSDVAGPLPNASGHLVDHAAVGDPGSERQVRPVDLALITSAPQAHLIPMFLRSTVEDIRALKNISVELLTESGEDGWTVPLTVLSDEDGVIDARFFVTDRSGTSRLRRASVFAFSRGIDHLCAAVIEATPAHVKLYPTSGQDPQEVWHTLRCAAVDFISAQNQDWDDPRLAELIPFLFSDDRQT